MERIAAILVLLVALGLIGLSIFGPRNFGSSGATFDREATIVIEPGRVFNPDRINMASGRVKINITNNNTILHKVVIFDNVENREIAVWESIRPGQTEFQWVDLVRGRRYEMYDPVWKEKDMIAILIGR